MFPESQAGFTVTKLSDCVCSLSSSCRLCGFYYPSRTCSFYFPYMHHNPLHKWHNGIQHTENVTPHYCYLKRQKQKILQHIVCLTFYFMRIYWKLSLICIWPHIPEFKQSKCFHVHSHTQMRFSFATLLWRKTPEFTLIKKQKIMKNSRHRNVRYRYLHIKIKVICIICIIFLTSSSLFLNILTIYT